MTAVASDFTWFADRFPHLARAYCLTLVRGRTPADVLDRLGAVDRVELTGVEPLVSAAYARWAEDTNDRFFVAATAVGDWTLLIEPNGFLGVAHRVGVPLSAGTRLVAHFRTAEALDQFSWIEDGEIRLRFEPQFPGDRSGSAKDDLVEAMRQAGFAVGPAAAQPTADPAGRSPVGRPVEPPGESAVGPADSLADEPAAEPAADLVAGATFALTEYLTGVRLTPDLLDSAVYSCGSAAAP